MEEIFYIIKTNYKKSFDFKGRQGRKEFWIFFLFSIFIFYFLVFLIYCYMNNIFFQLND